MEANLMRIILCVTIFALALIPFLSVSAKVTFHADLESEASVVAGGGVVAGNSGQFLPGVVGNGWQSNGEADVIHYPFEGAIEGYKSEGTLELWVTLGWDMDKFTDVINAAAWRDWGHGEVLLFWSYNNAGTDAIGITIGDGSNNSPIGRFMVREAVEEWHISVSEEQDWKEGETHHMAGTWGPGSVNVYLDGEWAGGGDDGHGLPFQGGPANPIERLSINNNESDPPSFPSLSIVDEVKMHDDQKDDAGVRALFESVTSVDPGGKLAATWGEIKNPRR